MSDFFDANFETFFVGNTILEMLTITVKEQKDNSETSKEHYSSLPSQRFQNEHRQKNTVDRRTAGAGPDDALRVFQQKKKIQDKQQRRV